MWTFFRLLINCYAAVKIIWLFDVSNYLFFVIEKRLKRQIRITFRAVFFFFLTIILLNENNLISVFFLNQIPTWNCTYRITGYRAIPRILNGKIIKCTCAQRVLQHKWTPHLPPKNLEIRGKVRSDM